MDPQHRLGLVSKCNSQKAQMENLIEIFRILLGAKFLNI